MCDRWCTWGWTTKLLVEAAPRSHDSRSTYGVSEWEENEGQGLVPCPLFPVLRPPFPESNQGSFHHSGFNRRLVLLEGEDLHVEGALDARLPLHRTAFNSFAERIMSKELF